MNILICDDHPIVCNGLEEVLRAIFDNLNIVKAFDIDSAISYINNEDYIIPEDATSLDITTFRVITAG